MNILSIGIDAKTKKGETFGFLTGIFYGAPAEIALQEIDFTTKVKTMCPFSTAECRAACLYTAGRGGFSNVQKARIEKTRFLLREEKAFLAQLEKEISALIKKAARENLTPAVRLNGTTDYLWERTGIMDVFKNLQYYDYTKFPAVLRQNLPANYHLTFSYSGLPVSAKHSIEWAARGVNTAAVFRPGLPAEFLGRPVLNGDLSDLRFLDKPGHIVGLKAKGKARKGVSAFVTEVDATGHVITAAPVPSVPEFQAAPVPGIAADQFDIELTGQARADYIAARFNVENVFGDSFESYLAKNGRA